MKEVWKTQWAIFLLKKKQEPQPIFLAFVSARKPMHGSKALLKGFCPMNILFICGFKGTGLRLEKNDTQSQSRNNASKLNFLEAKLT